MDDDLKFKGDSKKAKEKFLTKKLRLKKEILVNTIKMIILQLYIVLL